VGSNSPAGRDQRVAPLVGRGHAHVADQHVRQTSNRGLPYTATIRQGLSCKIAAPACRLRRGSVARSRASEQARWGRGGVGAPGLLGSSLIVRFMRSAWPLVQGVDRAWSAGARWRAPADAVEGMALQARGRAGAVARPGRRKECRYRSARCGPDMGSLDHATQETAPATVLAAG